MNHIYIFSFCLMFSFSYAAEYRASFLGTEVISAPQNCSIGWTVSGINEKEQVFGGYVKQEINKSTEKMYILDKKHGLFIVGENDDKNYNSYDCILNNAGQLIGRGPNGIFLWSKSLGVRPLNIFNTVNVNPLGFNDLGQLIGTYYDYSPGCTYRPFLWDNGVLTDMGNGTEFAKNLEALGYYIMDIQLRSINNKGEMAGYFCYGKYNERQKKYVKVGYKTFFWDGSPHLIDLQADINPPEVLKVNNGGVVLVRNTTIDWHEQKHIQTTYLWDSEKGLQILPDFYGEWLNDSSIVLGLKREKISCLMTKDLPAIWKDGHCITLAELLGVSSIDKMATPFSDSHEVERIMNCKGINNKNQIVCEGLVWGETHPIVLEPVKSTH